VGVRVEREDPRTGARVHTASAFLTFVALDARDRPRPVPPLIARTPEEKRRQADAARRRALRLAHRAQLRRARS
jgi:acyl-CoA hydrolase